MCKRERDGWTTWKIEKAGSGRVGMAEGRGKAGVGRQGGRQGGGRRGRGG